MKRKLRLDELLVKREFFADPKTAASFVMARKVRVAGEYLTKPGRRFSTDVPLEVEGLERRYASRGGEKLEAALARFELTVEGSAVLDAGASTGGFTDCLLKHGAACVYAVDTGFGQLRGRLAADPRVVVLERTNISTLTPAAFSTPIDLCVADLSYLSVAKSLPILAALFQSSPRIVHLIKPLFEGIASEKARDLGEIAAVFPTLARAARSCGLSLIDLMASPLIGSRGTVEFFGLFSATPAQRSLEELAARALGEARELIRASEAEPP